jgi:hypothetical protein
VIGKSRQKPKLVTEQTLAFVYGLIVMTILMQIALTVFFSLSMNKIYEMNEKL